METYTKPTQTPELHTAATARFATLAAERAEQIWGPAGHEITSMFRPSDVARIVAEELAPLLLIAREIAETERDIAQINLAYALAKIAALEA